MLNHQRKTIGTLWLCIFLLGLAANSLSAQNRSTKEIRTTLIAGLDFVPEILEMIRQSLSRKITQPVSLAFLPVDKEFSESPRRRSEILLIENGIATAAIPLEYEPTPYFIDLVWVMLVRPQLGKIDGAMDSLENFGKSLLKLKSQNPHVYPWFESLYSSNTLLSFHKLFSEPAAAKGYEKDPFWQQDGMVRMLYRAMEQGLLNPLSVEADQALATKVFLAGDSQCFTVWVPVEFLDRPELVKETFGEAEIFAFPGKDAVRFPKMALRIWKTDEVTFSWAQPAVASSTLTFVEGDFAGDQAWLKSSSGAIYDMLIMGDF